MPSTDETVFSEIAMAPVSELMKPSLTVSPEVLTQEVPELPELLELLDACGVVSEALEPPQAVRVADASRTAAVPAFR
jgi:hypothetical protein